MKPADGGARFRLYSIGTDRVDDGGTVNLRKQKPGRTRLYDPTYQGDWVWGGKKRARNGE